MGENLSYENEKIFGKKAEELTRYQGDALSVVCIYNENACPYLTTHGICDEEFIRGKAPMTKEEVRCVSLSKLRLTQDSVCYDVGAGTGSVSVEMALRADQGQVFAIEKKEEAAALLVENKIKFAADNLEIIKGEAPEAMRPLPCTYPCIHRRLFRKFKGDCEASSGKKSTGPDGDKLYYSGNHQ